MGDVASNGGTLRGGGQGKPTGGSSLQDTQNLVLGCQLPIVM